MLYALIAAAVAVFDQYFKYYIVTNIELGGQLPFLPGIVHLTYVRNTGAAFSLLNQHTWLLTVITAVFIVGIIVYMFVGKLDKWSLVCCGAVVGGAVGNLIDRIRLSYVVDMFEVEFMEYAVFNVADCFIVCGVIAFAVIFFFTDVKSELSQKRSDSDPSEDKHDDNIGQ